MGEGVRTSSQDLLQCTLYCNGEKEGGTGMQRRGMWFDPRVQGRILEEWCPSETSHYTTWKGNGKWKHIPGRMSWGNARAKTWRWKRSWPGRGTWGEQHRPRCGPCLLQPVHTCSQGREDKVGGRAKGWLSPDAPFSRELEAAGSRWYFKPQAQQLRFHHTRKDDRKVPAANRDPSCPSSFPALLPAQPQLRRRLPSILGCGWEGRDPNTCPVQSGKQFVAPWPREEVPSCVSVTCGGACRRGGGLCRCSGEPCGRHDTSPQPRAIFGGVCST